MGNFGPIVVQIYASVSGKICYNDFFKVSSMIGHNM